MPGMNAEVTINVGLRENVLAIPYASLRTPRDVISAATVLNLDPQDVQAQLASTQNAPPANGNKTDSTATHALADTSKTHRGGKRGQQYGGFHGGAADAGAAPNPTTAPGPAGGAPGGGGAMGGGGQWRGGMGGRGGGGMGSFRAKSGVGGHYIVFVMRNGKPTAVNIKTGLTDMDYVEVLSGLNEGEKVIVLPSASLVNSQKEMRDRMQRVTGGGGIPGMNQQQKSAPSTPPPTQK
jgi:hypothetical protein